MADFSLCFQFERAFYTGHLGKESFVNLQPVLNLGTAVDDCTVVTVSDELSDTACRHLCVFLCHVHTHLTCHDNVFLA